MLLWLGHKDTTQSRTIDLMDLDAFERDPERSYWIDYAYLNGFSCLEIYRPNTDGTLRYCGSHLFRS